MLILAVDTSGKNGSIALAQGQPDGTCTALEIVPLAGGTFSAQLVPQIVALLNKHGFSKVDIEGFAVASGPGSFTGLRVGLAAVKGLADVLGKPIATVSLLEAIASLVDSAGPVLAAMDAGRNEIYLGEYELTDLVGIERLLPMEEFGSAVRAGRVVSPDKNIVEYANSAGISVIEVVRPRGDVIARLGWRKIVSGRRISPEELEANYIRRSDAEIFSSPTRSK